MYNIVYETGTQPYMLDLELGPGKLDDHVVKRYKSVWLQIRVDGWPETYYSSKVRAKKDVTWVLPARMLPSVQNLTNAFIYVTLCGEGKSGTDEIGAAKISLSKIPVGPPQVITFPVVSVQNFALGVAMCTIKASIGAAMVQRNTYPNLPAFRHNFPPPGSMTQR